MKMIRLLGVVLVSALLAACETKQDIWDTGVSSPYHDCSIMQYMRENPHWELTVEMIERAGLIDLFEGRVDTLPEITFWGFGMYSVKRHLLDNGLKSVEEMRVEECRALVLKHVMKGKVLKADIAYRDKDYYIYDPQQTGGTEFLTLGGNRLKGYIDRSEYNGVPSSGAETLYLYSFTANTMVPLASPDIQPVNGVVHSLNDNYILGKI